MKNKVVSLTEQEIGTLLWAIQKQSIAEAKRVREKGKNPSEDLQVQRLNELSKKLYIASL